MNNIGTIAPAFGAHYFIVFSSIPRVKLYKNNYGGTYWNFVKLAKFQRTLALLMIIKFRKFEKISIVTANRRDLNSYCRPQEV